MWSSLIISTALKTLAEIFAAYGIGKGLDALAEKMKRNTWEWQLIKAMEETCKSYTWDYDSKRISIVAQNQQAPQSSTNFLRALLSDMIGHDVTENELSQWLRTFSGVVANMRFVALRDYLQLNFTTTYPLISAFSAEKPIDSAVFPSNAPQNNLNLFFSVQTFLAYHINENYYGGVHFVWCADSFDDKELPPFANPKSIYHSLINTKDKYSRSINEKMKGILAGAAQMYAKGKINKKELKEIIDIVNRAPVHHFRPVLYLIHKLLIQPERIDTVVSYRNNIHIIADLSSNECEMLEL
ncbi:MAG: hypothetical protein LBN05_03125 [Oscillospiraceae bacterium]|jgi:hypothetical protein|nr:hypothetical protein [Oscillospiraceae bacterium]